LQHYSEILPACSAWACLMLSGFLYPN
jgi:hypothetical protein